MSSRCAPAEERHRGEVEEPSHLARGPPQVQALSVIGARQSLEEPVPIDLSSPNALTTKGRGKRKTKGGGGKDPKGKGKTKNKGVATVRRIAAPG